MQHFTNWIKLRVSRIGSWFFTHWATRESSHLVAFIQHQKLYMKTTEITWDPGWFFFLRMIFCSSRMDLLLLLTDNCIGRENLIQYGIQLIQSWVLWQPWVFPTPPSWQTLSSNFVLRRLEALLSLRCFPPSPVCLVAPEFQFWSPCPCELPQALLSFSDSQPPLRCLSTQLSVAYNLGGALGNRPSDSTLIIVSLTEILASNSGCWHFNALKRDILLFWVCYLVFWWGFSSVYLIVNWFS